MSQHSASKLSTSNQKLLLAFTIFFFVSLLVSLATLRVHWIISDGKLVGPLYFFFEVKSLPYIFVFQSTMSIWVWRLLIVLELILPLAGLWTIKKCSPRMVKTLRQILLFWILAFFLSYIIFYYLILGDPIFFLGKLMLVSWSPEAWMRAITLWFGIFFWLRLIPKKSHHRRDEDKAIIQ